SVFDHKLIAVIWLFFERIIQEIDIAGDRGPMRGSNNSRLRIEPDGQEVAVRTPVVPQERAQVGQALKLVTAAQHNLRGAQRTGGDDYLACRLAPALQRSLFPTRARNDLVESDAVSAIDRLDKADIVQRADFRVIFFRLGNVVQVKR